MKLKTKMLLLKIYTYVVTGLLAAIVFACQVAVFLGLVWLIMNLWSCSSSRQLATETLATESVYTHEIYRDSISSALALQADDSRYLDISDMQILFYPPEEISIPDSMTTPTTMKTPTTPIRTYPMLINIGSLSSGNASKTTLAVSKDSVGSKTADISHEQSVQDSEQRIRDPTKPSWPVMLSLFMALIIIIYTGFMLYRSNRS